MSSAQRIGRLGEGVVSRWLRRKGFGVIERNVEFRAGEIDIVALRDGVTHFCEVKAEYRGDIKTAGGPADRRPEEKVHRHKQRQIGNAIQMYLENHPVQRWQFDVLVVFLNPETREAKVKMIENVIL